METVKTCVKAKDWTKDGKVVPIYSVTLTDGTTGESFGKEIPPGTEADKIEITDGQYGKKFRLKEAAKAGWKGGTPKGNESFALAYSKDWAIAQLQSGKPVTTDNILKVADAFYDWLENKKK